MPKNIGMFDHTDLALLFCRLLRWVSRDLVVELEFDATPVALAQ